MRVEEIQPPFPQGTYIHETPALIPRILFGSVLLSFYCSVNASVVLYNACTHYFISSLRLPTHDYLGTEDCVQGYYKGHGLNQCRRGGQRLR